MRNGNDRKLSVTVQYLKKHYHGAANDKGVKGTAQRCSATYGRRGRRVSVPEEDQERLYRAWMVYPEKMATLLSAVEEITQRCGSVGKNCIFSEKLSIVCSIPFLLSDSDSMYGTYFTTL